MNSAVWMCMCMWTWSRILRALDCGFNQLQNQLGKDFCSIEDVLLRKNQLQSKNDTFHTQIPNERMQIDRFVTTSCFMQFSKNTRSYNAKTMCSNIIEIHVRANIRQISYLFVIFQCIFLFARKIVFRLKMLRFSNAAFSSPFQLFFLCIFAVAIAWWIDSIDFGLKIS